MHIEPNNEVIDYHLFRTKRIGDTDESMTREIFLSGNG